MTRNRHIQLLTIEYAANARGVGKTHSYEQVRGLLLGTTYSDGTTARAYSYNHLGQLTQVVDDAGIRTIGYNAYNEQETDSLLAGEKTHLVTELRDDYGRSSGYTYANNGSVQQIVSIGYGTDGRISSVGFVHGGAQKLFTYSYLPGANLLQTLVKPNNMTLTQSYEEKRDLLIGQLYKRSNTSVASRTYTYDTLGRPVTRSTSKDGSTVNDTFGYNSRSELNTAMVNNKAHAYDYDNIGNRETAQEAAEAATFYESNQLNQYTAIGDFEPTYDDAGNQTKVKTSTGIWSVVYNAENRPTSFTNADSGTIVECSYDYMGRRATKKVTVNGSVTLHQRFLYRGYLQIACCDLTRSNHPCLWLITWDPLQPVATRPLAIQKDGTWYTYGWDLTKNICEIYGQHGYIRTFYTYTPYGQVASTGDVEQPIQWSSEFFDFETSTNYYNYRYYLPKDARWLSRDNVVENSNDYVYVGNKIQHFDIMGAEEYEGYSDTISIPKLDEYLDLENGIDLFKFTIIESDSWLTQKIKKEINKGASKLNFTGLAKELCKGASGEIESFLMNGLKESHLFPYDIKEKYGPDIKTFSQFPYYLAGIKEVKKNQPVRDNISVGIAGSITFPMCDVMDRTAGAKVNANLTFINNDRKAYAYKFKHKQKPGFVDEKPTFEIGPVLRIENYQLFGGEVNASVEVKGKQESWGKIDIVGTLNISYKLTF